MNEREAMLGLYRTMWEIRAFEETAAQLLAAGELQGNLHLSIGQEGVAAGVCSALRPTDQIATTHRGHGHCVAKGGDLERMFAELYGHVDGYCRGRAGSMHIADPGSGILGATAIVGGSFGMAVGAAFSSQVLGDGRVAVAFFGEGAAAEGSLHEALNLTQLWRLPVLFVCENNQYAELTHVSEHISGAIPDLAAAHGMAAAALDGNDVLAVRAAAGAAVERARAGEGPTLLECETYRWSGHYVGDPERYRSKEEVESWKARDPIPRLREQLLRDGAAEPELESLEGEVRAAVEAAAERAAAGVPTPPELIAVDVYAEAPGKVAGA
jgi:TPP-dependent pyruvate/acetoin dehydrogenase alpha subunit